MLILAVDKVRSSAEEEEEDVVRIILVVLFVDVDEGLVVVEIFAELVKFEMLELVKLVRVEVKLPDVELVVTFVVVAAVVVVVVVDTEHLISEQSSTHLDSLEQKLIPASHFS